MPSCLGQNINMNNLVKSLVVVFCNWVYLKNQEGAKQIFICSCLPFIKKEEEEAIILFKLFEWIAFSAIPEDGRRKAYAESLAKVKAEEEARVAAEKAREAAEATKKLEQEVQKLSEQEARAVSLAEDAQEKADAAGASVEILLNKAKDFGSGLSWEKFSSQLTTAVQKPEEKPKVQIATVRGQAKARSLPSMKAVVKPPSLTFPSFKPKEEPKPRPKGKQTEEKKEVRKVFGGLFTQETIYIDEWGLRWYFVTHVWSLSMFWCSVTCNICNFIVLVLLTAAFVPQFLDFSLILLNRIYLIFPFLWKK